MDSRGTIMDSRRGLLTEEWMALAALMCEDVKSSMRLRLPGATLASALDRLL